MIQEKPPPRVLKSHFRADTYRKQMTQDKVKVVVIVRNPKDLLVSLFHFYRMNTGLGLFPGTWDEFFELFKAKQLIFGDYFDWYQAWWKERDNDNVLFVHYEDIRFSPVDVIRKMAEFYGSDLTEEKLKNIAALTDFDHVKSDPVRNKHIEEFGLFRTDIFPFLRSGTVGDWKNHFTAEQSQYVDDLYEEKFLSQGLRLRFD